MVQDANLQLPDLRLVESQRADKERTICVAEGELTGALLEVFERTRRLLSSL